MQTAMNKFQWLRFKTKKLMVRTLHLGSEKADISI